MDIDPNNIRLTFELPAALGPELMNSAASLATANAAAIELIDIKPKFMAVTKEWVDSPAPLFTEVVAHDGYMQRIHRVVTTENMAHFFEANGVDKGSPAAYIIGAVVGRYGRGRDKIESYVYRPAEDMRETSYRRQQRFNADAGIIVDTAPELMDKIRTGKIEPVGLGTKRQRYLEAYMDKLLTSLQLSASGESIS